MSLKTRAVIGRDFERYLRVVDEETRQQVEQEQKAGR